MSGKKIDSIETIELRQAFPEVFAETPPRGSQVWLTDLTLRRGSMYMIEAASGTGKSSLCAYLFGSRRDFRGQILFNGTDVNTFSVDDWQEIRRRHLAYLPQELDLFPELTALQNIHLKNDLTGHASEAQILDWLKRIGIADRADFPVGKMSIGQQQRVAIIRAICQPFDFILLDEPVSHLDAHNNNIAAEIIGEEAARLGAAIIATSVGNQIAIHGPEILLL